MARAIWNGTIIAESDTFERVDGNIYFPRDAVKAENLRPSPKKTVCGWKGECSYFHVIVGDDVNQDAAWVYEDPKPAADNIRGFIAFWRGVTVEG